MVISPFLPRSSSSSWRARLLFSFTSTPCLALTRSCFSHSLWERVSFQRSSAPRKRTFSRVSVGSGSAMRSSSRDAVDDRRKRRNREERRIRRLIQQTGEKRGCVRARFEIGTFSSAPLKRGRRERERRSRSRSRMIRETAVRDLEWR